MLSAVDVRLLLNAHTKLSSHANRLRIYKPGHRRVCSVLLLRFGDKGHQQYAQTILRDQRLKWDQPDSSPSSSSSASRPMLDARAQQFLQCLGRYTDDTVGSSLRVLLLCRADINKDRWSGRMAFPGGHRDADHASDRHAAEETVYEQLGIPLDADRDCIFLGQLPDHQAFSRSRGMPGHVLCRFVYLHVGDMAPTRHTARHEVESLRWVPLRYFFQEVYTGTQLQGHTAHPLREFVDVHSADEKLLLDAVVSQRTLLNFPCVNVPLDGTLVSAETRAGNATWPVWGQTLRSVCELLQLDERAPIDWPLCRSNSLICQYFFINPYHGYYELLWTYYWVRACMRFSCEALLAKVKKARRRTHADGTSEDATPVPAFHHFFHGTQMQQRGVALPSSANALLYAVPQRADAANVCCLVLVCMVTLSALYLVAAALYLLCTAIRLALRMDDKDHTWRHFDEAKRRYYIDNGPYSVERERQQRQE